MAFDLSKVAGKGTESIDPSVMGMPLLQIIQSGSPEVKRSHEKHEERKIEGAAEGDIVFVPEKLLFKEGVEVIPLATRTVYTQWRNQNEGGGFIAVRPLSITSHPDYRKGTEGREKNKEFLGNDELMFTIYVAVLFRDPRADEWKKGIISFTSTQLKKARSWTKQILSFRYDKEELKDIQPPMYSCIWKLTTRGESNESGDWMGWRIELVRVLDPDTDESLLEEAAKGNEQATAELPSPTSSDIPKQIEAAPAEEGDEVPF